MQTGFLFVPVGSGITFMNSRDLMALDTGLAQLPGRLEDNSLGEEEHNVSRLSHNFRNTCQNFGMLPEALDEWEKLHLRAQGAIMCVDPNLHALSVHHPHLPCRSQYPWRGSFFLGRGFSAAC